MCRNMNSVKAYQIIKQFRVLEERVDNSDITHPYTTHITNFINITNINRLLTWAEKQQRYRLLVVKLAKLLLSSK